MTRHETDILVIGAGIVGIATAYYLKRLAPTLSVTIIDQGQPMAFTSAQSGENYRNWWPHPTMKRFTDYSIDLMEQIAVESGEKINLTRRGYLLATRERNIDALLNELHSGYGSEEEIRLHTDTGNYRRPISESWRENPDGVDILQGQSLIHQLYPALDPEVHNIIHIRRGGTVSSQQLGQYMLETYRAANGTRITGEVSAIDTGSSFKVSLKGTDETILAEQIVNTAGPFAKDICRMVGIELPVHNVLHQKIAFPDIKGAIPRKTPFAIDLDPQLIDWTADERGDLEEDPELSWVTEQMPGAIHCRPEGGDQGNWIKLGWAFNSETSDATLEPHFSDHFPEIVLRGAARLHPALKQYYGHLPRGMTLYGGYYTMTKENWPLVGPSDVEGFYLNTAMSGFGTMAACAGGKLCAQWVLGKDRPDYAANLSLARYDNAPLLEELYTQNKGVL